MVFGIKDECIAEYLGFNDGPGVGDLLEAANMRNFSIFMRKLPDEKFYELAYLEYHGNDYEAGKARLAKEPRNIAWLKQTYATQVPFESHSSSAVMERIFFNA